MHLNVYYYALIIADQSIEIHSRDRQGSTVMRNGKIKEQIQKKRKS